MGNKQVIPVLAYHRLRAVDDDGDKNHYNISLKSFSEQMQWLNESGFSTLPLESVVCPQMAADDKKVLITFDDGDESNMSCALPILERFGFKAVFFITTGAVSKNINFMNWNNANEILRRGHYVQSHGHTHKFLNILDKKEMYYELKKSRDSIGRCTGIFPLTFSCPGGRYDGRVIKAAIDVGYKKIFTSKPGYFDIPGDANSLLIGRYMVTRAITFHLFKKIMDCDGWLLFKNRVFYTLKNYAKKFVGEERYQDVFNRKEN